jgi:hypothetical protein
VYRCKVLRWGKTELVYQIPSMNSARPPMHAHYKNNVAISESADMLSELGICQLPESSTDAYLSVGSNHEKR